MKVLIAGGGIGGLALGLSLHAAGIDDVEVFEAAPSIEELGVGINVLPHAVRELTELGLGDELSSAGLATSEFVMFNKHGQRIWGEPRGLAAGYRWPQYSIHRGRLLGVLYRAFVDRLGGRRLHTDHRVLRATQDDASVTVHLASGARVVGDVLVGADGVHSVVRAQLAPGEGAPLWNGITMWRALAEAAPCLTGSSMVIIGHFGKRAVVYPITNPGHDGRSFINVVLEAKTGDGRPMPRQDWTRAVDRDEIRALFGPMHFDWLDVAGLIETAPQWWQYPMVDRDPLPAWRSGRITLLGDAAHPMYPVGANGASQAILDARTLARSLALAPTIDAALDDYESTRRPATATIVLANRDVGAEKCMELAEQRAPNGFDRIEDVFAPGELEELSTRYKRTAGFAPDVLNERPSLSVQPPPTSARLRSVEPAAPNIRDATAADADFIAWAIHTGGRSHLPRSPWEYMSGQTPEQTLAFHRRVATTDTVHMSHWSLFLIAEVDGRPAATLCGYDVDTQGPDVLMSVAADIAADEGVVFDDAFFERVAVVGTVSHATLPGTWVIENVATHPDFRRRGLVRELLQAVLDRGRARGFTTAQVSVFIGNDAAREAYLELGFESVSETRDLAFEAAMGSAGSEQLVLTL